MIVMFCIYIYYYYMFSTMSISKEDRIAPFDNHWSLGKNEYSPTGCYWFLEVAVKSFAEIPVTQE